MPRWPAVPDRFPDAAANTRCGSFGSIAILPIAPLSGSPAKCQCLPPSVDLYMPVPKNVSPPPDGLASPVPAHTCPLEPIASEPIVCVSRVGQTESNVWQTSVVFHTLPP